MGLFPLWCRIFPTAPADAAPLRHIGLYVYRRSFLDVYIGLAPTPAERCESLEQLRVLQHGYRIAVAVWEGERGGEAGGIDTPEQYEAFVARWLAAGGRAADSHSGQRAADQRR